ncbi:helix-turn-helix domain-containing protein [Aquiflexum lacus]|uniref:helix-turn-helix domain-containing protein n=1 Tax=Aquiflexum lacus TaxID=2483805 RepID=UPI00189429D4|nr:AraC family transcriptional regulator [Aquiflexum lacus]
MVKLKNESNHKELDNDYVLKKFDIFQRCEFHMIHFHNFWEVVYCTQGAGDFLMDGFTTDFKNGLFLVIPPDRLHRIKYNNERKGEEFVLHINSGFLERLSNLGALTTGIHSFSAKASGGLLFLDFPATTVSPIVENLYVAEGSDKLSLFVKLLALLSEIQSYQVLDITGQVEDGLDFQKKRFQKILEIVETRYQENLTTEEISSEIAMTQTSFCRFFKAFTNKTFKEFLNNFRIQEAKRLLINSDLHMSEIAFLTGFSSLSYFDRTFKKLEGKSPNVFRRKYLY